MRFSLTQLECFVAVAEAGSIAGARKGLHLSQPTVSQHLQHLEAELGVRLFRRTNQGSREDPRTAILTLAGQRLYPLAKAILALAQTVPAVAAGAHDATDVIACVVGPVLQAAAADARSP